MQYITIINLKTGCGCRIDERSLAPDHFSLHICGLKAGHSVDLIFSWILRSVEAHPSPGQTAADVFQHRQVAIESIGRTFALAVDTNLGITALATS